MTGWPPRPAKRSTSRFGSFDDLDASIQASVERLRTHAWLKRVPVHGLVFDVATGRLREVTPA